MAAPRRLKTLGLIALLAALALLAWTASGPWRTVAGIRQAIVDGDARALARHVDFPALRASLRPQVQDRIVRAAGAEAQSGMLSSFGLVLASGAAGGVVDAMVTPLGLGAVMEGRKVWNRFGSVSPPAGDGAGAGTGPLPDPRLRYESFSRASATITLDDGSELILVFTRKGTRWRLAEMRLPQ